MRNYQPSKRSSQIFISHDKQKKLLNIYLLQIDINISILIESKILNQNST